MQAGTAAPRAVTGCDLQRVDEVTDAIGSFGDRYLDRVYTRAEQDACRRGAAGPAPESLAGRFAAKEAVLKLIGTPDGVDLRSVEITHDHGRPVVRLSGRAAALAAAAGLGPVDVSISHTGDHALAVAVALAVPPALPADVPPALAEDPSGSPHHRLEDPTP